VAIQSFADKVTQEFFTIGKMPKKVGWATLANVAARKLDMLHYAAKLDDLKAPPGNRLEALKGDLNGFYSIRINDQWRIVFQWTAIGPTNVRIIDYHS